MTDDLIKRVAKLEAALQPFVKAASLYDKPESAYGDPCPLRADPMARGGGPCIGDLRKARIALTEENNDRG